ncbi:MAG: hypothetical protein AAFN30_18585 [Actinomycetota bacterium]
MTGSWSGWRRVVPALGLVVTLASTGCGSSEPANTEYTQANREAFLAACTDAAVDDRLVRDICECTYGRLVESVDLAELTRIEEALRLDTLAPLPDVVAGHVADCVVEEADL